MLGEKMNQVETVKEYGDCHSCGKKKQEIFYCYIDVLSGKVKNLCNSCYGSLRGGMLDEKYNHSNVIKFFIGVATLLFFVALLVDRTHLVVLMRICIVLVICFTILLILEDRKQLNNHTR